MWPPSSVWLVKWSHVTSLFDCASRNKYLKLKIQVWGGDVIKWNWVKVVILLHKKCSSKRKKFNCIKTTLTMYPKVYFRLNAAKLFLLTSDLRVQNNVIFFKSENALMVQNNTMHIYELNSILFCALLPKMWRNYCILYFNLQNPITHTSGRLESAKHIFLERKNVISSLECFSSSFFFFLPTLHRATDTQRGEDKQSHIMDS